MTTKLSTRTHIAHSSLSSGEGRGEARPQLPRYLVERQGEQYIIWDTHEHEETGFTYPLSEKAAASTKCNEFNQRTPVL